MANLFAASFILLAALAMPSSEGARLVHPKGTLVLTESGKSPEISAKFSGEITLTGVFVAMRDDNDETSSLSYAIRPDEASRSRLPHFDGYLVNEIGLEEGPTALRMVAEPAQADAFVQGRVKQLALPGTFTIGSYSVGVDCDVQWAEATLIRAEIPSHRVAARLEPFEGC